RAGNAEVSWRSLELASQGTAGGITTWSAPLPADAPDAVQFIVQAPDAAGNVAVSTNKGSGYSAGAPPPVSQVHIALSPAPASPTTWVAGPVTATVTSDQSPARPLEVSIDGAPFAAYTGPVTVSADGIHTIEARDDRGASEAEVVRIDGT